MLILQNLAAAQTTLFGESIIEGGLVHAILQTSLTGAGLILAIYTIFMQVSSKYFELKAIDYADSLKVISDDTPISQLTLAEIDKIKSKRVEIFSKGEIPSWLDKWIRFSFLGYVFSALIAVLQSVFSSLLYDVFLLFSFIGSTLIFTYVGSSLIVVMVRILRINYDELKLKVTETERRVASKETEILKHAQEIISHTFEDDDVGKIPHNWIPGANMSGSIQVTDQLGAEGTSKSLMIHNPDNSRDLIMTPFEPLQKFSLLFSLRQEKFGENGGVGMGLILFQDTTQAIWFCIEKKKLMGWWGGKLHEFIDIVLDKWYKIRLDIDCTKHEYYCYVDDILIGKGFFRNVLNSINRIQTADWYKRKERIAYLDEIKILISRENSE